MELDNERGLTYRRLTSGSNSCYPLPVAEAAKKSGKISDSRGAWWPLCPSIGFIRSEVKKIALLFLGQTCPLYLFRMITFWAGT